MAILITPQTILKRGEIVRVFGEVLGIVVKHEKIFGRPGFYAFNNFPGARKFIKENRIDWYKRRHVKDLAREKAEIITRDELIVMYNKKPSLELETLIQMTRRQKVTKQKD